MTSFPCVIFPVSSQKLLPHFLFSLTDGGNMLTHFYFFKLKGRIDVGLSFAYVAAECKRNPLYNIYCIYHIPFPYEQ